MPSPSLTGTGALWPPDLSSLIPDLFVALVTGAAVGVFVIIAERWLSRRSQAVTNTEAQHHAVRDCEDWMLDPLQYNAASLMADHSNVRRIRKRIANVSSWPVTEVVSGFESLQNFVRRWEMVESKAEKVDRIIARINEPSRYTGTIGRVHEAIHAESNQPGSTSWGTVLACFWDTDASQDPEFMPAVMDYMWERHKMELSRRGFVEGLDAYSITFNDAFAEGALHGRMSGRRYAKVRRKAEAARTQATARVEHATRLYLFRPFEKPEPVPNPDQIDG